MPMRFRIREVELPILPKKGKELRILHFSDVHLSPRQQKSMDFIRTWNSLDPDLVISTGDHISHPASIPLLVDALGPLLSKPGYFVFGSNDYYGPKFKSPIRYLLPDKGHRIHGPSLPTEELDRQLTSRGWINLTQKKLSTGIHGISLELRGTDDAHLHLDNYAEVSGEKNDVDLSIGITHAPYRRVLEAMGSDHLDVIFAGHTHGGQIRLPWFRRTRSLTTNCDLPNWRSRGLTRVNSEPWLHVSAGMGHNPLTPFRFLSPREVSLVRLVPHS